VIYHVNSISTLNRSINIYNSNYNDLCSGDILEVCKNDSVVIDIIQFMYITAALLSSALYNVRRKLPISWVAYHTGSIIMMNIDIIILI